MTPAVLQAEAMTELKEGGAEAAGAVEVAGGDGAGAAGGQLQIASVSSLTRRPHVSVDRAHPKPGSSLDSIQGSILPETRCFGCKACLHPPNPVHKA